MVANQDFHDAFLKAEEDIKFAELSVGSLASIEEDDCNSQSTPRGIIVPSINELRYAARHFSNAIQLGNCSDEYSEQIQRAVRHCIRARLDALRATVLFLVRHFQCFSQDYR
ncbi:MAG: hypothetical protein LBQ50_13700, partial [Planctomycetaceae bacterium]|nr:hypothetical protein [Planctomycetaceae bacterium]